MNRFFLFSVLWFFFLLSGCSGEVKEEKTVYAKIDEFLKTELQCNNLDKYDYLIVVNEMGQCINCNNSFSKAMSTHITHNDVLFLISTPGTKVDISEYINKDKSNILYDFRNNFSKLNLINNSAIIAFKNHEVDTIIEIDITNVDTSIESFYVQPLWD